MYINDRPITDFGVRLVSLEEWLNPPPLEVPPIALYGRIGVAVVGQAATVGSRTIQTKHATARGTTLTQRRTYASLLYRAAQGVVALRFDDEPTRQVFVTLTAGSAAALAVAMLDGDLGIDLTWTAHDPLWYDVGQSVIGLPADGSKKPIPMGNAPHGGVIHLVGAGTNPTVVTLRNRGGDALATMTLATTWTSAEYVEIDLDRYRIVKINNLTRTNLLAYLATTETFHVFSPEDGPMLSVTGCGSVVLYYRRAWLS
jgi:hypothetical protein